MCSDNEWEWVAERDCSGYYNEEDAESEGGEESVTFVTDESGSDTFNEDDEEGHGDKGNWRGERQWLKVIRQNERERDDATQMTGRMTRGVPKARISEEKKNKLKAKISIMGDLIVAKNRTDRLTFLKARRVFKHINKTSKATDCRSKMGSRNADVGRTIVDHLVHQDKRLNFGDDGVLLKDPVRELQEHVKRVRMLQGDSSGVWLG